MRREREGANTGAAGFCAAMVLLTGAVAFLPAAEAGADPVSAGSAPPASATASLDNKELQLRGLQDSLDAADARRQALAGEIETFKADHARASAELIDATRKVGLAESALADAQARLDALSGREAATKRSLDSRREVIGQVLAALQRMGRKPPPALLVDPSDVLKAIRTSMLLGAVLPGMRTQTEALVADLSDLAKTRKAIEAERDRADKERTALLAERQRLGTLIEARQDALGKAETEMEAERDKAKQLSLQASSLKDLIGRSEQESAAAARAAEAARRSDERLAALAPNGLPPQAARDPARLAPAVSFVSTKGTLALPATGSVLRRFGEDDGLGSSEKGMLLETGASAVVVAPADCWVAYAGPYRSFGQVLILNAGSGYYIVLAGMDRVNVGLGQFVLAGEPVAVMGEGSVKTAAAMALGVARPVLYVEFRKDGSAIDPSPWWAKSDGQRVRG